MLTSAQRFQWIGGAMAASILAYGIYAFLSVSSFERRLDQRYGKVIYETQSAYSHLRVRQRGTIRNLTFVDPAGREQRQSAIDLERPEVLQLAYTETFFATLLYAFPQERVLIVGLGGGGMVRFLNHHFPETLVEAVEIDPAVIEVASDYFETRPGDRTAIHEADAFAYLREPRGPFDVIYMDAFLKPAEDSGLETVTERLRTVEFLQSLKRHRKAGGIVAFNLIDDASAESNLAAIREAFSQVDVYRVPQTLNLVVITSDSESPFARETLLRRAAGFNTPAGGLGLDFVALLNQRD